MRTDRWRSLFDGRSLDGWRSAVVADPGGRVEAENDWLAAGAVSLDRDAPDRLILHPGGGVLANGPTGRTANLVCAHEHGDCDLHIEFVVPRGSNSGVYLMGRYEVQVLDSWGAEDLRYGTCGGIYARRVDGRDVDGTPPLLNACRPPGRWQAYDIAFRAPRFDAAGRKTEDARFVRVVWNGAVVHEEVAVHGPTRAALPGPEGPLGPLMLQGDHGQVAYRNIRIRAW